MSQAKVDRYKEEKRNRAKIMAKEKREALITKIAGGVIAAALVFWAGYSVATTITGSANEDNAPGYVTAMTGSYTVDTTSLDSFLDGLVED